MIKKDISKLKDAGIECAEIEFEKFVMGDDVEKIVEENLYHLSSVREMVKKFRRVQ